MSWQPIETAPKDDGFVALVFEPGNRDSGGGIFMGELDARDDHGWYIYIDGQPLDPTHWMPLPEPPEAKK